VLWNGAACQRRHEKSVLAGEQQPAQRNPNGLYALEPSYKRLAELKLAPRTGSNYRNPSAANPAYPPLPAHLPDLPEEKPE
jgi:hypothetical protein